MIELVKFHGTAEPVSVRVDAAGLLELQADPMVSVMSVRAHLFSMDKFQVLYKFADPEEAAREMSLPLRVSMDKAA